mmetsp:Transcript_32335/g.91656  ORF Transcript_32335/g.91656 Transcript_32335/m.91656 type:complete len:239 (+) Transcript_32335:163-879(+)
MDNWRATWSRNAWKTFSCVRETMALLKTCNLPCRRTLLRHIRRAHRECLALPSRLAIAQSFRRLKSQPLLLQLSILLYTSSCQWLKHLLMRNLLYLRSLSRCFPLAILRTLANFAHPSITRRYVRIRILLVITFTASFSSSRLIMSSVMFPVHPMSCAIFVSLERATCERSWTRFLHALRDRSPVATASQCFNCSLALTRRIWAYKTLARASCSRSRAWISSMLISQPLKASLIKSRS